MYLGGNTMKQKAQSRILAILLIFCLFAGLFQCAGIAASAAELPSASANTIAAEEKDEAWLQSEIDGATKDQAIVLPAKDLTLTKPIIIPEGKAVVIKGADKDKSIITTELKDEWKPSDKALLIMEAHSTLTIENLTIDGNNRARCILVNEGDSTLNLANVTIQNGASTQYSGVAIHSSHPSSRGGNTININAGCTFTNNIASTTLPTSGGAIYIGADCTATLVGTTNDPIRFSGNTAHSGACIYAYKAYVYAEHCEFGDAEAGNTAGQRGGALHCHGTMVLKDCSITNNSSGQYGGGIYISASAAYCPSSTGSNHSLEQSSPGASKAM